MTPHHTRGHRRSLVLVVALTLATIATACGHDAEQAVPVRTPGPSNPPLSTTAPTSSTTAPVPLNLIATAKPGVKEVVVHSSPGGPVERLDIDETGTARDVKIASPTPAKVAAVFLVKQAGLTAAGGTWHEVYLPVRPNGSTGWVSDAEVALTSTDLSIGVSLSAHRLTVMQGASELVSYPVAVGTTDNPTPTGLYFIKELVAPDDPKGAYGPLAFGLSGHSDTIKNSAEFADGVIGIHGTDHPELIGQNVSHGCVRMKSEDILDLQRRGVPLGTPVTIAA